MGTKTSSLEQLEADKQTCIDPNNSVVVTACAGSGKTWLLTSRILRIIIEEPDRPLNRILAITFTNNAAAEIEKRVRERLRELVDEDEKTRKKLLREIGVSPKKRSEIASIYRSFITKRPTLSVFTFHSWFTHLIQYLPWEARSSFHTRVADSPKRLQQRAWEQMLENIKDDESDEAEAMRYLLGLHKLRDLQESMVGVIDNRAEWYLYFGCSPEDKKAFQAFQEKKKPKEECTKQDLLESDDLKGMLADLEALVDVLKSKDKRKSTNLKKACEKIEGARQKGADCFFKMMCKQIIENSTAREGDGMAGGKGRTKEIISKLETVKATYDYIYNKHCARIGTLYAQQYARLKEQEGVIDYADMELIPLRAIITGIDEEGRKAGGNNQNTDDVPFLREFFKRLDDSYDHILVDEFQDTNPVQWLMLHAWLEESKGCDSPKVFIVGDPKQSVYSWRGGNPKLLGVARNYLEKEYEGEGVRINHTRRCSQKIVDAVNEVFSGGGLDSFERHEVATAEQKNDSSLVYRFQPQDLEISKSESTLRNPLDGHAEETDNSSRKSKCEGEVIADKIKKIKGCEQPDKGEGLNYEDKDIMLLHPKRKPSVPLVDALAGAELPCSPLDKSKRMDCLECQDILALLHAIFDPGYGLMVAQVLRSPIFGVLEEDLWKVYRAGLSVSEKDGKKYCSWVKGLDKAEDGSEDLQEARKMLRIWRTDYLSQKLPAHELLARCYAHRYKKANLIERYVKAVPGDIAKRVVLNLDWILNYSLEAQGGRLVLPSEYAAHLRELSEAGEETDLANEGEEVIRSLTVHGAKGLENKVVIVTNSVYFRKVDNKARLLATWDLEKLRPDHLSFYRNKKNATKYQMQALEKQDQAKRQEENNLLYVAMTRARQHLFFSKQPNTDNMDDGYIKWWDRIECSNKDGENKLESLKPWKEGSSADESDIGRRKWLGGDPKSIRVGKQKDADNADKIKGTQRHNLLALILQNEEAHEKVMDDNQLLHRRLLGIGKDRLKKLHKDIKKVLDPKTEFGTLLAQVDKNQNPIECELSAIGEDDKIGRIDCLLTTKDGVVWVIDFKTGDKAHEDKNKDKYDEQLRYYHKVVSKSYPEKEVRMAIVDKDGGMREVKPA